MRQLEGVSLIRWCSYCQSYQGEVEPFDDYSMTHMICEHCEAEDVILDECTLCQQRLIAGFYSDLRSLVRERRTSEAIELLGQAPRLKIRCSDLVAGLIQPLLHWLGDLLVCSQVRPEQAEQYIAPISLLLDQLDSRYPDLRHFCGVTNPVVLLHCEPGPIHRVGLRVVELGLAARGVSNTVVTPGFGYRETVELLLRYEPLAVGFTVHSDEQLVQLEQLVADLRDKPVFSKTKFLVGGTTIRLGRTLDAKFGLIHCREAMDILRHLDAGEVSSRAPAAEHLALEHFVGGARQKALSS